MYPPSMLVEVHLGGSPLKYKRGGGGEIEIYSLPKETREFNGVQYLMEEGITGDYALIKVYRMQPRDACVVVVCNLRTFELRKQSTFRGS